MEIIPVNEITQKVFNKQLEYEDQFNTKVDAMVETFNNYILKLNITKECTGIFINHEGKFGREKLWTNNRERDALFQKLKQAGYYIDLSRGELDAVASFGPIPKEKKDYTINIMFIVIFIILISAYMVYR